LRKGSTLTVTGRTRHQLVHGQLSVAIPVDFTERLGCMGDFILGDLTVVVRVERRDDRRDHRPERLIGAAGRPSRHPGTAFGSIAVTPAFGPDALIRASLGPVASRAVKFTRRTFAGRDWRSAFRRLGVDEARRKGERQRDYHRLVFHGVVSWFVFAGLLCRPAKRAGNGASGKTASGEKDCRGDAGGKAANGAPSVLEWVVDIICDTLFLPRDR
jgi:hypothetical protein